tara:strand:+ start:278 stop:544 length:267 start_codon:yes stop_codon:yes gene_type:complete
MHNLKLSYKGMQMACLTSQSKFKKSVQLLIEAAMLTDKDNLGAPEVIQLIVRDGYLDYQLKFPHNFYMYIGYEGDMSADQILTKALDL